LKKHIQYTDNKDLSENLAKDLKKVVKGAGITLGGSITGRVLWFLCQIIIARSFGAEIFGLYILGLGVLKLTGLFARFGLHIGAMRFVSIYREDEPAKVKGILISASLITFINGIFVGGAIFISSSFISEFIFQKPELVDVIKIFAQCVPFMATMMVVASASRGFHTTKYYVYIKDIIQPTVNIGFVILFILLDLGILGIIYAFIISYITALFVGFHFIARQFQEIKEKSIKSIFEHKMLLIYSVPLLFSGILTFLISWTDIIMLGFMKTSIDVGIYRSASQIAMFLTLFLTASNSIYAPAIAEMYYKDQMNRLEKIFKTTTRWIFLLILPPTLVITFSASEVMSIFGHEFIAIGGPVLIILTIAKFISCSAGGVGFTLNMTGKQNVEMLNSFILVISNIALNYYLIPRYGSLGAAMATGFSLSIINLVRLLEVYIMYKIHPYNLGFIKGVISGVVAIIFLLISGEYVPDISNLVRLALNTLAVSIIFITFFIVVGINDEDKFIFYTLAGKIGMHFSRVAKI
jgi:O-antigen/teichoic acid export membrane protein